MPPPTLCANRIVLWNNRTAQSVRLCRPIKLAFAKAAGNYILIEKGKINSSINRPLLENKYIIVKFNLFMTLIDGKL